MFDSVLAMKIGAGVVLGGLLAVEALPIDAPSRIGAEVVLLPVVGWLLWKTIPQMLTDHKEAITTLATKTEAGMTKVADEVKENGDKLISILERTLPDSCDKE